MPTTENKRTHLVFTLAGDDFVVAIEQVRELVAAGPLTPVPGAPPWVRGVFNLRGSVVPLVDLGVKFGTGTSVATLRTSWVVAELVIERSRHLLAFEADEVREITDLGDEDLLVAPPAGLRIQREYVRGVVRTGEGFALVLDLERVLRAGESIATGCGGKS